MISLFGALVGLVPMLFEIAFLGGWDGPTPVTAAMVLYLGIGNSVLGYVLWNRALSGLPAAAVGTSLYAQPVLGAGLSWLLLRDPLPPTFILGAVLVLTGVYIAAGGGRRAGEITARRRARSSRDADRPLR